MISRWMVEVLGVLILIGGGFIFWTWHDHSEQKVGAERCEHAVSVVRDQAVAAQKQKETQYAKQTEDAQELHDNELRNLPALHVPVLVHDGALCANPVRHPETAVDTNPPVRGTIERPPENIDLGPAFAAFALKYETALADCRKLLADWPQ